MSTKKIKKIPSALKWMAETRARLAGELEESMATHTILASDVELMGLKLSEKKLMFDNSEIRIARLTKDLAAVDQTILLYDQNINPQDIAPINAWKGKYGKRGSLRSFLIKTLQGRPTEFLKTPELAELVIIEFSLVFETAVKRKEWHDNSLSGCLKFLRSEGAVESLKMDISGGSNVNSWRWRDNAPPTLARLAQMSR